VTGKPTEPPAHATSIVADKAAGTGCGGVFAEIWRYVPPFAEGPLVGAIGAVAPRSVVSIPPLGKMDFVWTIICAANAVAFGPAAETVIENGALPVTVIPTSCGFDEETPGGSAAKANEASLNTTVDMDCLRHEIDRRRSP
jgi:hypothetical protein